MTLRLRKHPDGYWIVYGPRNKRLTCIVMPTYADNLGLSPSVTGATCSTSA